MLQHYDKQWLSQEFEQEKPVKYLFFWGHTPKAGEQVGKFCFSQWYELPFEVDGITYRTAEHWMMAKKAWLFNDFEIHERIINAVKAGEAKDLGREVKNFDDQLWKTERFEIVKQGNIHKFSQNQRFADYLVATGDRVLVEASPRDTIWGIGLGGENPKAQHPDTWRGLNLLGFALMEVRDVLKVHK
ncbi:NADAR family protein [Mucilaginibacter rubeus]|uniref:NADAR family protein n=1 Tax=Mucilaginibacter rubeus TaxID=2027860 RepID=A0AAE6MID8_9SPHI|nr:MULTISPECIES: NADAR family protein [Mucilaginibacter]QEM04536.1 NADAR family protein [Mucilaginibacter rubeus]QEM17130.1 NADAR family protein [Mucilaginibacter gossypii]QTE46369.1 NADAR family protein [Mucilaginibacter rubeus]QTE52966.1 NADAR family protein [Mucilaginibacter rubeus]QTE58052.1 NADAR family protein [Mucilaginibacter rubeus]